MGSCISCANNNYNSNSVGSSLRPTTAKVISIDGVLSEHLVPITAGDALVIIGAESSSLFLCSSDGLFMDVPIQGLNLEQPLRPGQIYFVLPMSELNCMLTGAKMAALATRASSALSSAATAASPWSSSPRGRNRIIRVRPVAEVDEITCQILNENSCSNGKAWRATLSSPSSLSPTSSLKKKKETWTKVVRRSFRGNRLGTINEIFDASI